MKTKQTSRLLSILDFDLETVAAGFADPQWVPQKITVIAWSWVGSERVDTRTRLQGTDKMIGDFLKNYEQADMLTGHNLLRFDLPILNSECMRLGFPCLTSKLVQDTMRIRKTKGFKKGQDNIGKLLQLPLKKQAMDWQDWQDGYDEKDWKTIKERASSDVLQHKMMRLEMIDKGWLKGPVVWRP